MMNQFDLFNIHAYFKKRLSVYPQMEMFNLKFI